LSTGGLLIREELLGKGLGLRHRAKKKKKRGTPKGNEKEKRRLIGMCGSKKKKGKKTSYLRRKKKEVAPESSLAGQRWNQPQKKKKEIVLQGGAGGGGTFRKEKRVEDQIACQGFKKRQGGVFWEETPTIRRGTCVVKEGGRGQRKKKMVPLFWKKMEKTEKPTRRERKGAHLGKKKRLRSEGGAQKEGGRDVSWKRPAKTDER